MGSLIHYTECPACNSTDIMFVMAASDHTVSRKEFEIWECSTCKLRFTQDVPDSTSIASYYKAENYISHTDSSKGLINRLYKLARKRTLQQKRKLVEKYTSMKKGVVLDIGSGTGAFVHEMKLHGWDATGLEPDAEARKVAENSHGVILKDISDFYNLMPGTFDAITMWHVLEHVHELHNYLEQIKALLKPVGKLFIAVPNYTSEDSLIYGRDWAAYDVPRHLYHFAPATLKMLQKKHGLIVIQTRPMWLDSFYVSLLSSRYKKGRTQWLSALWNGLRSNLNAMANREKCSSIIYVIARSND